MLTLPQNQADALTILLSLRRFGQSPETQGAREWLRKELTRLDTANRRELDEVAMRQRQGACSVLDDLFRLVDEADQKIAQMRGNEERHKRV